VPIGALAIAQPDRFRGTDRAINDDLFPIRHQPSLVPDWVLDEMADSVLRRAPQGAGTIGAPTVSSTGVMVAPVTTDRASEQDQSRSSVVSTARLAVLGLAAGLWARGAGILDARKRKSVSMPSKGKSLNP
jgi:hypothetical protein